MEKSNIKSHIQQFASSGADLKHIIIERCFETAYTEYPSGYKAAPKHILVAPIVGQTSLSWTRDGTGVRACGEFGPGDLILNPSGYFSRCQWHRDTRFTMAAIKPSSIMEICGELEIPDVNVPRLFHFRNSAMNRTMQRLISCFETPDSILLEAEVLELMLIRQVVGVCRKHNEGIHRLSKVKLMKVHDFIQDQLAATLTIEGMALVAGYSASRFLLLFRNTTGYSPHQYVMQQRLKRVTYLLSATVLSLSAIAVECGFADQSHLIRLFRRHTGLTPNQFRKHGLKGGPT